MPRISLERRVKPAAPEPKFPWMLPLLIGIAVATLVVIIIYSLATGVFFG